jgi:hypothetical protein
MKKLKLYDSDEKDETLENSKEMKVKFRLLSLLNKAYNIVAYIYKLLKRIMIFKKLIRRMILINNCIKWNS